METQAVNLLAPLNPLFFQRFDSVQLERMLRSMPILKLSKDRFIFGGPSGSQSRGQGAAFLLLAGRASLYLEDPENGAAAETMPLNPGDIFGDTAFHVGDEACSGRVPPGVAAKASEVCLVGVLSREVTSSAFADRMSRIAGSVRC